MHAYDKHTARLLIANRLQSMDPDELKRKSNLTAASTQSVLSRLLPKKDTKSILIYQTISSNFEVDLRPLQKLYGSTVHVLGNRRDTPIPSQSYDIVFVPLYGFNSKLDRLGKGGGWYDRFFSRNDYALKIGVGIEDNFIEFIDVRHDIPMDMIITDERLIYSD